MLSCDFENFDITIRGESAPYGVTARFQNQTADGTFHQEIRLPFWQRTLHQINQTLYTPSPTPMMEAGAALYDDLFRRDVRDLWIGARAGMERNALPGLRVRLALQPPAVAALPWETLYDPDRGTVFAISSRIQLVRVEQEYRRLSAPAPPQIQLPLRILIAAPQDPDGVINAKHEIQIVKRMLKTFGRNQVKIHTMTGRFSIVDLRRRLEKVQPHVLHILTHGVAQGIQLWQNGRPRMVPAASVRATLERTPWVRFVFLNACLTGQNAPDHPLSALAPQLLQAGVPAVLAMQFEIRDDVATEFAHFLYEAFLTGSCAGIIDAAVTNARAHLYVLNHDEVGFVTPVVWLNADDGRIFTFEPNGNSSRDTGDTDKDQDNDEAGDGEDSEGEGSKGEGGDGEGQDGSGAPSPPPSAAADVIDIEDETSWLAEMDAEVQSIRVKPELEFALRALTLGLQTLRDLLDRLRNWDHRGRVQAYEEQTAEYRRQKAEALRLRRKLREAM